MNLIVSPLSLHLTNDTPGVFVQIRRALKPDGLFVAAIPGSGTLQELRKLSTHTFRVNLTFAETSDELVRRLQALDPEQLQVNGKQVEMVFHGEEAALLGRLADISRDTPILQFEVRGPTLEEIFIALMKETR